CNCKDCKESDSPELYDKNYDLVERTKKGKLKIECRKSYLDVEILPILGAVYNKEIIEFYTREEIEKITSNYSGKNVNIENLIIEQGNKYYKFGKKSHIEKSQFDGINNKIEENGKSI
ncbi:MAG: hypothetical protein JNN23_13065, partial [Chryseobacterium gambrini]|nr:hypothetical protein [Chryseobacterium gambrini]